MDRFLALGDSYTIGEGVAPDACWPAQLAARLRGGGVGIDDPRIIATTGWTTDELFAAVDAATFAPSHALVTLLIGVNDQYRGRGVDEYRSRFHALLQRAVGLGGGDATHLIVVSIPDWGGTSFAARGGHDAAVVEREIDAFNAVARAETGRAGAHWVDVTAISRATESRDEVADDGLHPSGAQYARWVDAILPVAGEVLKRR
ncbi:MAG TPA: SGNH/GDSL hydrolase family protein [Rhodanobacteraceae bacterium]|nr:SGNH/GDSL hydrolase family protein [Rhodanobacteraceae bacterium]